MTLIGPKRLFTLGKIEVQRIYWVTRNFEIKL